MSTLVKLEPNDGLKLQDAPIGSPMHPRIMLIWPVAVIVTVDVPELVEGHVIDIVVGITEIVNPGGSAGPS
jgi:hypothetical protein